MLGIYRNLICSVLLAVIFFVFPQHFAAAAGETILFVPHDSRPISSSETAEVVKRSGFEVLTPPEELLSTFDHDGKPDELWQWIEENVHGADAAVISSDALIYGGLIPSRKHELSQEKILERVEKFQQLGKKHPFTKIYVFGSLMRTPYKGTPKDIEEPEYYQVHGGDIFMLTMLTDKAETSKLTKKERNYLSYLQNNIPADILSDWMERRAKNLAATKKLIDFTADGTLNYFIVGRDDNAPLSQTHRENRELQEYAAEKKLPAQKFQSLAGIDEFGILLLTRAANDIRGKFSTVFVEYNRGKGADTIPAFSDEKISESVKNFMSIVGGMLMRNPNHADFVLLVNTDPKGKTLWEHNRGAENVKFKPNLKATGATKYFSKLVEKYVEGGYSVAVADINYANGSDNALMKILQDKNLLYKLHAYGGWNTATNTTGFALGTGILAKDMTRDDKNILLSRRYLDEWAYQANVRTIVGNELLTKFNDPQSYYNLGDKLPFAEAENTKLMNEFAEKNLPHFKYLRGFKVTNPWKRMFECKIEFAEDDNAAVDK